MSFFRRLKMPPVPTLAGQKWESSGRAIEDYFRKLRDALSAWDPDASPVIVGTTTVDGAVTLGDTSTIEATQNSDGTGITLDVVADSITNQLLSPMTANTVKANATSATANPSDVSVGTNTVLGRVAGDIVAAQLATGQIANSAVTYPKVQNVSATSRLLGRVTSGAGVVEEVTPVQAVAMLTISNRPSQFVAAQNNLALSFGVNFVSSDASRDVTGIVASTVDGQSLEIINVGTQNVVLKHLNGGSTGGNQIITPAGADLTLAATQASVLWYDLTATKWRAFAL